jgi:hypothetical protein
MLNILSRITAIASLGFILGACEEVIDIDLNSEDPQVVIEASLYADADQFEVRISQTSDYFDASASQTKDDAMVILIDEKDNETILSAQGNGLYITTLSPKVNSLYRLRVSFDGQTYEAESFLPEAVPIIGLETEYQAGGGPIEEGYQMFIRFQDDAATANYYRQKVKVDGVFQNSGDDLRVTDDRLFNGGRARLPVFQAVFQEGEEVEVELVHFDAASFDYFNSLTDIVAGQQGPNGGTAAPRNPNSNWSNGALGFFSASSSSKQSIIIQ